MDLIERLDATRRRWNILEHPFYVRWERGQLTRDELAYYAAEYRHAVVALARAARRASELTGPEHAAEEEAHVDLWDDFAAALESDRERAPLAQTARCAAAWTSADDPLEAVAILYAIEAGQPDVSETKLAGLVEHYGFAQGSPGTAYFELHAERDHEHAASSRVLLEEHASDRDAERLVSAAEAALAGNWALLDGVSAAGERASVNAC
ncbi:MAG: iron-containing redox enzyme family protein [Actinomycetota bacterium]|nr:iron-containing redox enzyme family protein [Actinomycetota bacterium]